MIVHVYKTIGDDPYPWTLTVRTDNTANLIVGGGHGGGDDKVVHLQPAVTRRTAALVDAIPWKKVDGHTVEPGGFGGNDNMARYMIRRGILVLRALGKWHHWRRMCLVESKAVDGRWPRPSSPRATGR